MIFTVKISEFTAARLWLLNDPEVSNVGVYILFVTTVYKWFAIDTGFQFMVY